MRKVEVLVIGAGPAGSTAARAAAEAGADVLLVEMRERVGEPVQCAEYVPRPITGHVDVPDSAVAQDVESMLTHAPAGDIVATPSNGYMVDRAALDRHLAEAAEEVGAELLTGTEAKGIEEGEEGESVTLRRAGDEFEVEAEVVVGADGPRSAVANSIDPSGTRYVRSKQVTLPLTEPLKSTEVFLRSYVPGGYGWLFPKGDVANVGVGVDPRLQETPGPALDRFLEELLEKGRVEDETLARSGGLIPVGGPRRLHEGSRIVAGDAAGLTHPITGAGIPNAVISGAEAGEAAARASREASTEPLEIYAEETGFTFGDSLGRAVERRERMVDEWSDDPEELDGLMRSCWVAFEPYFD